jgi:hypothetical protein
MKSLIQKARVGLTTLAGTALYGITTVMAQTNDFGVDAPNAVKNATNNEGSLRGLILTIVNFFLGFLGLIAVLMIIYGGVLIVTSAGAEDKAKKGKQILTYAAIGIVIILLSFAFVATVLQAGSGNAA